MLLNIHVHGRYFERTKNTLISRIKLTHNSAVNMQIFADGIVTPK